MMFDVTAWYLEAFEHGDVVDEALVHQTLLVRLLVDYVPEGLAVHCPKFASSASDCRSCPRLVVQERQLPETTLLVVCMHQLFFILLIRLKHVEDSAESDKNSDI